MKQFKSIHGVDFSGAKLAGRTIWIARCKPGRRLRLVDLFRLETVAGTADREPALAHLVRMIADSRDALWAIDFPFGLPTAVMRPGTSWSDLLRWVNLWKRGAYDFGVDCLRRAQALGGRNHLYR